MTSIRLPTASLASDHWLTMDEARLFTLTEDTQRALCRDWPDRTARSRHLMLLALFHQLDAVRAELRRGAMVPEAAATAMRSPFALGWLAGLAAAHATASGLAEHDGRVAAARLDLYLFTFGAAEGQRLLRLQRAAPPAAAFAQGRVAALGDMATFLAWLENGEEEPSTALCDAVLRLGRDEAGLGRPVLTGWA